MQANSCSIGRDQTNDISRVTTIGLLAATLVLALALRLPGSFGPFDNSIEGWTGGFYACMGRNCLRLQSLTPILNPMPVGEEPVVYANHPPLPIWAVAGSFALFGESEFAARLPFLLASLLSVVIMFRLGSHVGNRLTGILGALFLACCPVAAYYGDQVEHVGSLLLLAVIGTALSHFRFYRAPSKLVPQRTIEVTSRVDFA